MTPLAPRGAARERVAKLLGLFADVRPHEVFSALVLAANVFLLLAAYYVLKVVREPLILAGGGGAEIKSYSAAGQALLLIFFVKAYDRLFARVDRMRLITWTTLFFASNLLVFYALAAFEVPLGIAFFLWVGIFNVFVVAQFWSFANDVYTEEQGKRLFAIVGAGSALGAVAGAWIARLLIEPLGPFLLMPLSAGVLVACLGLTWLVHRRSPAVDRTPRPEAPAEDAPPSAAPAPSAAAAPARSAGGFALVWRDRYLALVAALLLILNWVNTTGEYILDRVLVDVAEREAALGAGVTVEGYIGEFKAEFFGWVNLTVLVIQLFLVSRILKYLGVRIALFLLPLIVLGNYAVLFAAPALTVIMVAKVLENGTDYSLYNTVRHALFLVTTRDKKYKAKVVIDTFFVRIGDVLSAGVVALGSLLAFTTRGFIAFNFALTLVWLGVVWAIGREYRRRAALTEPASGDRPPARPERTSPRPPVPGRLEPSLPEA